MATATPAVEKVWKPHKRQEDFVSLPDDMLEGFYGGSAGSGKSELLVMLPILRGWHEHPNFHGIIFRRTFPELEESLIMMAKEWYPLFGGKYNDQKHYWTFPSGAIIRFSYMLTDDDARSHDTAQYHYVGFDELTHFTEFQYRYLLSRIRRRKSHSDLPCIIRSASNPGNIGHGWVRGRFIAPWRIGYQALRDPKSGEYRIFIPAKLTDNPHIDAGYINRLRLLPLAEQKAKIEGDWWAYAGQVFTEFRGQLYPDEPSNALHVLPALSIIIPEWWPKLISIDWGYAAKTSVHWGAISPDARLFVYREYVCTKKNISVWAADIARISQFDGNIKSVELDPSAWQNRGQEKLIWMQVQDALPSLPVNQADNDRIGGKLAIHEMLRWEERPRRYVPQEGYRAEIEDRIFRMQGIKAANEYRKVFDPEPPELNLPKVQILDCCPELIDAIPQCVYEKASREGKPAEDVAEFVGDDPYDDFRYMCKGYDRYIHESSEEAARLKETQKVMDLAKTDMYSFYRRMEEMEAKAHGGSDVVRQRVGYFN